MKRLLCCRMVFDTSDSCSLLRATWILQKLLDPFLKFLPSTLLELILSVNFMELMRSISLPAQCVFSLITSPSKSKAKGNARLKSLRPDFQDVEQAPFRPRTSLIWASISACTWHELYHTLIELNSWLRLCRKETDIKYLMDLQQHATFPGSCSLTVSWTVGTPLHFFY